MLTDLFTYMTNSDLRQSLSSRTNVKMSNGKIKRGHKALLLMCAALVLSACTPQVAPPIEPIQEAPKPVEIVLSSAPIKDASREQTIFAQSALKKLGYRIGFVDGLWGPRSAKAIRAFEAEHNLTSAEGFLSELSLDRLATESGLDPNAVDVKPQGPKGITAKIAKAPLSQGPQLIIVERDYDVFIEPNPYSEKILALKTGTGIYIVNKELGWYRIESINRVQGYIQAD